jgi:hypothetical protein
MDTDLETFDGDHPTVKQAARVLGVDPARVRQWLKDGRLTVVEGSVPLRVDKASMLRLRDERASRPGAERPQTAKAKESALVTDLRSEVRELRGKVELLAIESGRREVLEITVSDLKQERDSLASQVALEREARIRAEALLEARGRRRWRRK